MLNIRRLQCAPAAVEQAIIPPVSEHGKGKAGSTLAGSFQASVSEDLFTRKPIALRVPC